MKNLATSVASSLLCVMAILMLASSWNDSLIMDELPHIPAGYSYLTQKDYRLNPEHPPLIKMFAAIPLLFQNINFPIDSTHWTKDINGQWEFGRDFFYRSENNPDHILFWARLPVMLLALFTGWLLFRFMQNRFGSRPALLALALFSLSPTIIAHSRFVTTDLGATFAFMVGVFGFVRFLENPTWKNTVLMGLVFGVAELLKFSLVLLVPMYAIIFIGWVFAHGIHDIRSWLKLAAKTCFLFAASMLVIWPVYQYTVWNYPPERQKSDTVFTLTSFAKGPRPIGEACMNLRYFSRCPAELTIALSDKPVMRPIAQYLLGVLMVAQRSAGGNTTYFMGEVSAGGSRAYFPIAYSLKEPLPILLFVLFVFLFSLSNIYKTFDYRTAWKKTMRWIRGHIVEFSSLVVIGVYWGFSIKSPLNIGIRHVLPTFPFIYLLTAVQINAWLSHTTFSAPASLLSWLKELFSFVLKKSAAYSAVVVLLLWLFVETLAVFPAYLSYYNEFAGGTTNGYMYITDSNYDWGQDLLRLKNYIKKNEIEKISLDYFGGGDPMYYLGNHFEPWWSARGPAHGWFAISATFRQGAFGIPAPGFIRNPQDSYEWLKPYKPVARAGQSIFIYNLP